MLPTHPDPSTLQPSPPAVQRKYSLSLRVAVACGALPLLTGVSIFLCWLVTGWEWLMGAGIITIYAGCLLFLCGIVALGSYLFFDHLPTQSLGRRLLICALVGLLLLSNFPVAGGIIKTVIRLESRSYVAIRNASSRTWEEVRIVGGGCDEAFGSIKPGHSTERPMRFSRDGELILTARQGDRRISDASPMYLMRCLSVSTSRLTTSVRFTCNT